MRYPHGAQIKVPLYAPVRKFEWKPYPAFTHTVPEHTKWDHFYRSPSGKKYPSVSKMLSTTKPLRDKQNLENWRAEKGEKVADHISARSRNIGTDVHRIMEEYLNNRPLPHMPLIVGAHFTRLADLVQDIETMYTTEITMCSDKMKLGGTCDGVGVIDGKNIVFDFKTKLSTQKESYINDYYLQMACYAQMWTESTGIKIDQIILFVSSESNISQVFVRNLEDFTVQLEERVKLFHEKS